MRALSFAAASWPSERERLLLQACLRSGAEARAPWKKWRGLVRLEDIDHASMRLLPLLVHTLERAGVDDPVLARYRGVHRNCWYRNGLLFHRLAGAIAELRAAGVPAMVLKGAALAPLFYPDHGRRPMSDGDLLVPEAQAATAVERLMTTGWRPVYGGDRDRIVRRMAIEHGCNFKNAEGIGLDLHWRASDFDPALGRGEAGGPRPVVKVHDVEVPTLAAWEHLLHTLVHGLPWNPVPSYRWVVDAALIVRSGAVSAADWTRLVERAKAREVTVIVAHALAYLREQFDVSVPEAALAELRAAPARRRERNEFRALTSSRLALWRVSNLWYRYRRLRRAEGPWRAQAGWRAYPEYLCVFWGLERPREIPRELARRGWGQVREVFGGGRVAG